MAKVTERVDGCYEVQDVEFGRVYKWRHERMVVECRCGQNLSLTASTTSCVECGSHHLLAVQGASTVRRPSGQTLHPWRYYYSSEDREDAGLPF